MFKASRNVELIWPILGLCLLLCGGVFPQGASAQVPDATGLRPVASMTSSDPVVQKHIDNAIAAAGSQWMSALSACRIPSAGVQGSTPGPQRPSAAPGQPPQAPSIPALATWDVAPLQVFDNLYYVGEKGVSGFAIKTSQGIILTDGMWDYDIEHSVVDGLKKLGLNPADIKYVIIPHGHPDHFGGVQYLREHFGTKVVAPKKDIPLMESFRGGRVPIPMVDIAAGDGDSITLGDTTIRLIEIPGHTPGGFALLFPVSDAGQPHTMLIWAAGAGLPADLVDQKIQIPAIAKLARIAQAAGADVLGENHGSHIPVEVLRQRKPGENHPFLVGTQSVANYLTVRSECAQARVTATEELSRQ